MTTPSPDTDKTARIESSDERSLRRRPAQVSQFAPGTIIAGRYRIAGILGSGGMGEVYRADDTKLDQPVALKFLPARLARDPILLGRLHDEVRLGRQVAHPNVCRIYDIVDWEGAHFVAMEYVDGEDLAKLLRRIGRLAHDKAVDIARGIAAGLMAAHVKGILHRDLKPANIMIDSNGDARIMDFGLALSDDEDDGTISGTPAYMAPEQLQGAPATVQSDLYSLGLVMYELFTGKAAHAARTLPERVRDSASEITTPSSIIRDLDPAVERIILRCLSGDPAQRPRSARQVIEALPGGDPLAAAMAAGETPSPRIVAAAGTEGSLKPAVAWSMLGAIVLLLVLLLLRVHQSHLFQTIGLTQPPETHEVRATEILRRLGVPEQRFHSSGFEEKSAHVAWIYLNDRSPQKWERLGRGLPVVTFWLREERKPLLDSGPQHTPEPNRTGPPQFEEGSSAIELDPRGRLISLRVIAGNPWKPRRLDWNGLLDTAGLSAASLVRSAPVEVPPSFADAQAAWSGRHPDDGTPIRVEAAAFRGVPVFFRIIAPWDAKDLTAQVPFGQGGGFDVFLSTMAAVALAAGSLLAWRNLRQRRGDRSAAARIAVAIFLLNATAAILLADHEPVLGHEVGIFASSLATSLLTAVLFAILYIAVEPYVRRRWPDRLIAWTRLVSGKWRDPMIGRDVLIGIVAGLTHAVIAAWGEKWIEVITGAAGKPFNTDVGLLGSPFGGYSLFALAISQGVAFGLVIMTVLMLLTILLRRRWLAISALFAIMFLGYLAASTEVTSMPFFLIIAGVYTFVPARYGLLAAGAMHMAFLTLLVAPPPDVFAWHTARAVVPVLLVLALAIWAFFMALGGQRAFAANLLDD
jgi:serine/threonine-protein kinase